MSQIIIEIKKNKEVKRVEWDLPLLKKPRESRNSIHNASNIKIHKKMKRIISNNLYSKAYYLDTLGTNKITIGRLENKGNTFATERYSESNNHPYVSLRENSNEK